jgi:hypothetical protein
MKHIGRRHLTLAAAFAVGLGLGVAGLASRASAAPPRQSAGGNVPLPVPYVSQMYRQEKCDGSVTVNGRMNCGPASLAMIIEANGKRPSGLGGQQFVAQVRKDMTGVADDKCQRGTTWPQVDNGAQRHGLTCAGNLTATSLSEIQQLTDRCIPVIALIDPLRASVQAWIDNPTFHGGNHFIVIVGVRDGKVWFLNPLIYKGGSVPTTAASAMRIVSELQMGEALKTENRRVGRGYGRPLGNCDANGCGGPIPGPGGYMPTPTPQSPGQSYDRVDVSMGSSCGHKEVQLFYIAGDDSAFSDRRSQRRWLRDGAHGYEKVTFDFEDRDNWRGTLKALRLDPTGTSSNCDVGFSWINITNDNGGSARFYDFYNHAGNPSRPLGQLLGWTAYRMQDLGPRSSWQLRVNSVDPQLVNPTVGVNIGR